jgi:hypothetical protein
MSIGGVEHQGKLVTIQTELPGSVDGILGALRQILLLGNVQEVSVKNGEPIVYRRYVSAGEEIHPSESTASFAEMGIMDIIRNVTMEELDFEKLFVREDPAPYAEVCAMMLHMSRKSLVHTHLVLSSDTRFWEWMMMPAVEQFAGALVEYQKGISDDVFLLCGAKSRAATITEITLVIKGNIFIPEEVK